VRLERCLTIIYIMPVGALKTRAGIMRNEISSCSHSRYQNPSFFQQTGFKTALFYNVISNIALTVGLSTFVMHPKSNLLLTVLYRRISNYN